MSQESIYSCMQDPRIMRRIFAWHGLEHGAIVESTIRELRKSSDLGVVR